MARGISLGKYGVAGEQVRRAVLLAGFPQPELDPVVEPADRAVVALLGIVPIGRSLLDLAEGLDLLGREAAEVQGRAPAVEQLAGVAWQKVRVIEYGLAADIAFTETFADRVRYEGIQAAWEPILKDLPPVIGAMVRDAIPRSDPASIAAAAAIGHDRSFRCVNELAAIATPTLVIPGMDWRHPKTLAEQLADIMPNGYLTPVEMTADIRTADDLAHAFAPAIRTFLMSLQEAPNA